jgi:hypothetical protein
MIRRIVGLLGLTVTGAIFFLTLEELRKWLVIYAISEPSSATASATIRLLIDMTPILYALIIGILGTPSWGSSAAASALIASLLSEVPPLPSLINAIIVLAFGLLPAQLFREGRSRGPTLLSFYGLTLLHGLTHVAFPEMATSGLVTNSSQNYWFLHIVLGSLTILVATRPHRRQPPETATISCPNCGAPHTGSENVCPKCGLILGGDETRIY